MGRLQKIKELRKELEAAEEDRVVLKQLQADINPPELVKGSDVTFIKFDPVRFAVEDDDETGYYWVHNWVLIGSLGDPESWDGSVQVTQKTKGSSDGLAGTLIDMNVMQEILYQRPSGY